MKKFFLLPAIVSLLFLSCTEPPVINNEALITSFMFRAADNAALSSDITAGIDGLLITALVPYGTIVGALKAEIELSEGATVTPASVSAADYSLPVIFTVSSEDSSKSNAYAVLVSIGDFTETPNTFNTTATAQLELSEGIDASDYFGSGTGSLGTDTKCPGGTAFSEDGSILVIGAPGYEKTAGIAAGAVFVFIKNGSSWVLQARLTGSQTSNNDDFGSAVAVSRDGTVIAVGAPGDEVPEGSGTGLIYIFERSDTAWSNTEETAVLYSHDAGGSDLSGFSVAMSADGGVVASGTPYADVTGTNSEGKIHVYERPPAGWADFTSGVDYESAELTISETNLQNNAYLGRSVAVSSDGSVVASGAPGYAIGGSARGAAFVFEEPAGGWDADSPAVTLVNESALLKAALSAMQADGLGFSIAMTENAERIAVGAPYYNHQASSSGAVLIYNRSGSWVDADEDQLIAAFDRQIGDEFGRSVSISAQGGYLLAGAPMDDLSELQEGSAYIYSYSSGSYTYSQKFSEPALLQPDSFMGRTCCISPDASVISVSAPSYDGAETDTGTVFIYQ